MKQNDSPCEKTDALPLCWHTLLKAKATRSEWISTSLTTAFDRVAQTRDDEVRGVEVIDPLRLLFITTAVLEVERPIFAPRLAGQIASALESLETSAICALSLIVLANTLTAGAVITLIRFIYKIGGIDRNAKGAIRTKAACRNVKRKINGFTCLKGRCWQVETASIPEGDFGN